MTEPTKKCEGPLVWFDAPDNAAILECAACDYVVVTGSFHDARHQDVPLMREGLAR